MKVEAIFVVALALTAIVSISTAKANAPETTCEPTTIATTEETTEYITEHTEAVEPTTEATEPIVLYDVPLSEELQVHIIETAEAHGIDPAIIVAMAYRESTYNPKCIGDGGDSYGLLQVQPKWHKKRMEKLGCSDLLDPFQNVTVAIDYLAENLERYGSIDKALVAYNAGHYKGTITSYAKTVIAMAEELRSELE